MRAADMIVDAHTHLGDFPLFNVRLEAEGLIKIMDECGIDRSLLFSLPNELTLEATRRYPDRISGLVWVNPYHGGAALSLIEEAISQWG
ncbi:MAG: amidohydrolase family protein, partial [Candidatus Bathyarchaeia archaeon]